MKTYKVQLKCDNCDKFITIEIACGVKVETYLAKNKKLECPGCGCSCFSKTWIGE